MLPFNLGAILSPPGQPPAATGGTIQNGRYTPARVDVYGQALAINELTFEFSDEFVQVGYRGFVGGGAVLASDELAFVGTATAVGTSLLFDVDSCTPSNCSVSGVTCSVPSSLLYSATPSGLVTIQPAPDGSTVVTTYSRQ